MRRTILAAAALLVLSACATAEPVVVDEEPAAEVLDNSYEAQVERAANAALAAEPRDSLPRGIEVVVESVEEAGANIFYKVQLLTAKNRRREEDYVLYGQCSPTDIATCAEQIVAAARMLQE
ncbi:MAG TPA: hypothetical protein VF138_04005 [Caulobacteraceae bacterium]